MKAFDVEEFSQICLDIEKDQKGQGNYANALFISELRKMISTFPTVDAVSITHCKDCKWYDTEYHCKLNGYGCGRSPDWFCADGKKEEE